MAEKRIKVKVTSQVQDFVKDMSTVQNMLDDLQKMKTSGQLADPRALAKIQEIVGNLNKVMNKAQSDLKTIPELASAFGGYTGAIQKTVDDAVKLTTLSQRKVGTISKIDKSKLPAAMQHFADDAVEKFNEVINQLATIGSQTLADADIVALRKLRTHKYITTGKDLAKAVQHLEQALDQLEESERRIALDTEGTGAEIRKFSGRGGMRTAQLKVKGQIPLVIDFDQIPQAEWKPFWDLMSKNHTKILQNASYDLGEFNKMGKNVGGKIQDTLLTARELAKLYTFLGESTITGGQGQALDALMNRLLQEEQYANLKHIFPFEKFSKSLRYGNEKAATGYSRWLEQTLAKDLQMYSVADVEALPNLMNFLNDLYDQALKKMFSPEAAAKIKAQMDAKMNEWSRTAAERASTASEDTLVRDEVQYDIKRAISTIPKSDDSVAALPTAFAHLQRATTEYKTGVYRLIGRTRDVVAHMVTNSNEVDNNLWNKFESMEEATRTLQGSNKHTKESLQKYLETVKDFTQNLPAGALKESLTASLKGVNARSSLTKLQKTAVDVVSSWSAAIEEAVKQESLGRPVFAYKGIRNLPSSVGDLRSQMGTMPNERVLAQAGLALNKTLTQVFDEYSDSITRALPYLNPEKSDVPQRMEGLHKAILAVSHHVTEAVQKIQYAIKTGDTLALEAGKAELQKITNLPVINTMSKAFLQTAKGIKTDDPALLRALGRIPKDLNQLGDKALDYVIDVMNAIERQISSLGSTVNSKDISKKFKTKPLQQINLPDIEKTIASTKNWTKLTPYGDIGAKVDEMKEFATIVQKLADIHVPAAQSGLKVSQIDVAGMEKPIKIIGALPERFRHILDEIFKKENEQVTRIAQQLAVVESQIKNEKFDKNALQSVGLTDIDKITDIKGLEQLKGRLTGGMATSANNRGLKVMNALKTMAPYVGEINQVVGQEMFALSNLIDDLADRIKSTSNSIKNEKNLIDSKQGGSKTKLTQMEAALKTQLADFHRIQQQAVGYVTQLMISPEAWKNAIGSDADLKAIDTGLKDTLRRAFASVDKSWRQRAFERQPKIDGTTLTQLIQKANELSKEDVIKQLGRPEEAGGLPAKLNEMNEALQQLSAQKALIKKALEAVVKGGLFDHEIYNELTLIDATIDKRVGALRNAASQVQKFMGNNQRDKEKANIYGGKSWAKQQAEDQKLLEQYVKQLATITNPEEWQKVNKAYQVVLERSQKRTAEMRNLRQNSQGRLPRHETDALVQKTQNQLKASQDAQSILLTIQQMMAANKPENMVFALNEMRNTNELKTYANDLISQYDGINQAAEALTSFGNIHRKQLELFLKGHIRDAQNQIAQLRYILGKNKRFRLQQGIGQARQLMDIHGVDSIDKLPEILRDDVSENLQRLSSELNAEAGTLKASTARGRMSLKSEELKEKIAQIKEKLLGTISLSLRRSLEADLSKLQTQLKFLSNSWKPETLIEDIRQQITGLSNVKARQSTRLEASQARLQEKQKQLAEGNLSAEDTAKLEKHIAALKTVVTARQAHIASLHKEIATLKDHISTYDQDMGQFSILNRELKETERNIERLIIAERNRNMQEKGMSGIEAFNAAAQNKEVRELITHQQELLAQKQQLSSMFKGQQVNDLKAINAKIAEVKANIAKMISGNDPRTAGMESLSKRAQLANQVYGEELRQLNKLKAAMRAVDEASGGGGGGGSGGDGHGRGFFGTITRVAVTMGSISFLFGQVRGLIQGLIQPGLQFANSMETSRIGLSSILVSLTKVNGQTLSWGQGMALAGDVIERVQQSATLTGQPTADLLKLTQGLMGSGLSGNMTLDQVVKFATVGSTAIRQIGMDSSQMIQELRDMVQGGIQAQSSVLATNLGITDADVERARAVGNLFEMLMSRMGGFQQGIDAYMGTLEGKFGIVREGLTRIMGEGLQPLYNMINTVLGELIDKLFIIDKEAKTIKPNPEMVEQIRELSKSVVKAIQDFINLGKAAKGAFDFVTTYIPPFNVIFGLIKAIGSFTQNGNIANTAVGLAAGLLALKPLMRAFSTQTKVKNGVEVQVTGVERAERDLAKFKNGLMSAKAAIVGGFIPAIRGIAPLSSVFIGVANGAKILTAALIRLTSRTIIGALIAIGTMLASEGILKLIEWATGSGKKNEVVEAASTQVKSRADLQNAVNDYGDEGQKGRMNDLMEKREELRKQFSNLGAEFSVDDFKQKMADNLRESADLTLQVYTNMLTGATDELQKFSEKLNAKVVDVTDEWGNSIGTVSTITAEDEAKKKELEAKISNIQKQIDTIRGLKNSAGQEAAAMAGVTSRNRAVDAQEMESLKQQEMSFWQSRIQNAQKVAEAQISILKNRLEIANNQFKMTIDEYYKKRFEYEQKMFEIRKNAALQQQQRLEKSLALELMSGTSVSGQGQGTTWRTETADVNVSDLNSSAKQAIDMVAAYFKQLSGQQLVVSSGYRTWGGHTSGGKFDVVDSAASKILENNEGGIRDKLKAYARSLGIEILDAYAGEEGPDAPGHLDMNTKNFQVPNSKNVPKLDQLLAADNVDPRYKEIIRSAKNDLGEYADKITSVQKAISALKVMNSREDTQTAIEQMKLEFEMQLETLKEEQAKAKYQIERNTMGLWASLQDQFGKVDTDNFWQPMMDVFKGDMLDKAFTSITADWRANLQNLDFSAVPESMRTMVYNDFIQFTEQYESVIRNASEEARPGIIAALKRMFEAQELDKLWQKHAQKMDAIMNAAQMRFNNMVKKMNSDLQNGVDAKGWHHNMVQFIDTMIPQIEGYYQHWAKVFDQYKSFDDPHYLEAMNQWLSKINEMNTALQTAADSANDLWRQMQDAKINNEVLTDSEKKVKQADLNREYKSKQIKSYDETIKQFKDMQSYLNSTIDDNNPWKASILAMYDDLIAQVKVKQENLKLTMDDFNTKILGVSFNVGDLFKQSVSSMSQALMDWAQGTKSASDAFREMAYNIITYMQQIVAEMIAKKLILSLFNFLGLPTGATGGLVKGGDIFANPLTGGKLTPAFATGGPISGPGTGTSDDILAWLSNGEYVLKARAVQKYGLGFIHALNRGMVSKNSLPKFAEGGQAGANNHGYVYTGASYGQEGNPIDPVEQRITEVLNVVKGVKEDTRKLIRMMQIHALTSQFGFLGGIATLLGGFATGGLITGPGTETSDSILARLSKGEFVVRAAAVRKYGVGYIAALNKGLIPRTSLPKFAVGGLVGGGLADVAASASKGSGGNSGGGVNIINTVDPNIVRDYMSSSAGNRVVLNVIESNKSAIRRLLG